MTARALAPLAGAGRVRGAAAARRGRAGGLEGRARRGGGGARRRRRASAAAWRSSEVLRVRAVRGRAATATCTSSQGGADAGGVPAPAGDGAQAAAWAEAGAEPVEADRCQVRFWGRRLVPGAPRRPSSTGSPRRDRTVRPRTSTRRLSDRPRPYLSTRWAASSRSPTRRAAWARPPPPSTSPPASPRPATRPCSSTSTRSATPRLALGLPEGR